MAKCVVTAETTCDLPAEIIKERNFKFVPISIILGTEEIKDGVDLDVEVLFDYIKKTGELPKTSAISVEEYKDFFKELRKEYDNVIHFCISSKASSTGNNAVKASEEIGGVYVVDTKTLSSSEGLLMLKASDMLREGKDAESVYKHMLELRDKVQTSFVVDTLDFLYKGGRCSSAALVGSKILKIHPHIYERDGELQVKKKYMGNLTRCLSQYVADIASEFQDYDKTRVFVTHSVFEDQSIVDDLIAKVKELFQFDEVIEAVAGATITTHCGRNTVGILFINN